MTPLTALFNAAYSRARFPLFADVSIIYHFIRGQEVVKLYVLFSVLEICDKLLYSFGADMLEGALCSAAWLCSRYNHGAQPVVTTQPVECATAWVAVPDGYSHLALAALRRYNHCTQPVITGLREWLYRTAITSC